MQKQKGISTLTGIIIIVAVAVILFGGVFAYQYFTAKSQAPIINVQSNPSVQTTNTETAGWKTYINSQYGFEIKYPSSWFYSEFTWNANINGVAFCPNGAGYNKSNCADVPMMNTPEAPIFINTATKPITSSSFILSDENYGKIYDEMLPTFKFTK